MKIIEINGKKYLVFDRHELGFSIRTSAFTNTLYFEDGRVYREFPSYKSSTTIELPNVKRMYFLKRYFSNRGHAYHKLYLLDLENNKIVFIKEIGNIIDVLEANIPSDLQLVIGKEFLPEPHIVKG